ncbi:MAG: VCBS repeat-containing protein [Spirosomataceae bacterium]
MKKLFVLLGSLTILWACNQTTTHSGRELSYSPPSDPLFVKLSAQETGIDFLNHVEDGSTFNILSYRNFYNGGGVAIGDVNNDGLSDVYLSANMSDNKLYLNKGHLTFEDITAKAGVAGKDAWATGVTMADVNADGWLDIYVCYSGDVAGQNRENQLFINQHNLTFKEQAKEYGLNDPGLTTHASFFDYDLDGDLDCYILNNSFKDIRKFDYRTDSREVRDAEGGHKLMRNDKGHFTDVSAQAGIYGSKIGFGLGVSVGDVNGDLYPDIYVSNDFFERDYLYINQQNGTFKESLTSAMGHVSMFSMGSDIGDINNDGLLDIFSTDMLPEDEYRLKTMSRFDEVNIEAMRFQANFHYQFMQNSLQLNNGDGTFSEIGQLAGVSATDWSWGALMFDFDNDGWKDLFVSNGIQRDITDMDFSDFLADKASVDKIVKEKKRFDFRDFLPYIPQTKIPNYAFVNQKNLSFQNKSYELGLGEPSFSNGSAYGDLDNDGDLDLVVNNLNAESFVYRNEAVQKTGNHFLKIKLQGAEGNPFGVGTIVKVSVNGQTQTVHQMLARGFESSVEPILTIGLGQAKQVDSLTIIWPNRRAEILHNLKVNQVLTVQQAKATIAYRSANQNNTPLWQEVTTQAFAQNPAHHENLFVDFNRERLMPKMLSTEGPKLAKGDINADGLEDLWVGGAKDEAGKIFVQTPAGSFRLTTQKGLEEDKIFEDSGAAFLDADGDKDLDLMVSSAGNEAQEGGIVRLYLNDGKGTFTASPERSPRILVNASCIRPYDVDADGDQDVFVGGRCVPGAYGSVPRSYILLNQPDGFQDATPPDLQHIGMVTDAAWIDFDKDGKKDLAVVGEWMPVTFFKHMGNSLAKSGEVPNSAGWWNVLAVADLDADGDEDLVAGNLGLNTKFMASPEKPMQLYVKDFDQNQVQESVLTLYKADGKAYPFHSKQDVVAQMPSLKKQFLHYGDFAAKGIDEIFTAEQLKGAAISTVQELRTCIFLNKGGVFSMQPLPLAAQISPTEAILVQDFDHDGLNDLLLGGNFYGLKPEVGRWDASYGTFLKGSGKGTYTPISNRQCGLKLLGQIRDAVSIATPKGMLTVFARNNEGLLAYKN